MKKNLIKKLVLKKHTVTNLDADKLKALRGGNMAATEPFCGTNRCGGGGGGGGGSMICSDNRDTVCYVTVNSGSSCCG
jgi:hypothetical protein